MKKKEFLAKLKRGLAGLPRKEISERLSFYDEMIDDRIEDGASEEDAVASIGDLSEIVSQIRADFSGARTEGKRKTGGPGAGTVLLLILGFPLWFPLLCAFGSILLSLYIVLWSFVLSLWAAVVSLGAGAIGGVFALGFSFLQGNIPAGFALFGLGFVSAGLAILLFYGCLAISKIVLRIPLRVTSSLFRKLTKRGN